MSKIRCDKCGALLKAGDIKKEKCWKCGKVVIQKVEKETQPAENITSEPVAQEDGKDEQTDENKTPDPVVTQSNSQDKTFITFLGITAIIFVINTIYSFIFMGGFGIYNFFDFSTVLVFLSRINPLMIPIHLAHKFIWMQWMVIFVDPQGFMVHYIGINSFSYLINEWDYISQTIGISTFLPALLWFIGPLLSFFVAKKIPKSGSLEPTSSLLNVSEIIKNSFSLGLNNKGLIIGASILWALTAWVPYLNVGTTIGFLGIIVSISKGNSTSATEIFNAKYLKMMGEFFLLLSFMIIGIASGYAFVIIPGIVISIAWSQSILLFIDKGYSPLESIKKSNDITYGEKWTIFVGYLSLVLILGLSIGLLIILAVNVDEILALLVGLIGYIAFILVMIGCSAYIYGELNKKLTAENN